MKIFCREININPNNKRKKFNLTLSIISFVILFIMWFFYTLHGMDTFNTLSSVIIFSLFSISGYYALQIYPKRIKHIIEIFSFSVVVIFLTILAFQDCGWLPDDTHKGNTIGKALMWYLKATADLPADIEISLGLFILFFIPKLINFIISIAIGINPKDRIYKNVLSRYRIIRIKYRNILFTKYNYKPILDFIAKFYVRSTHLPYISYIFIKKSLILCNSVFVSIAFLDFHYKWTGTMNGNDIYWPFYGISNNFHPILSLIFFYLYGTLKIIVISCYFFFLLFMLEIFSSIRRKKTFFLEFCYGITIVKIKTSKIS